MLEYSDDAFISAENLLKGALDFFGSTILTEPFRLLDSVLFNEPAPDIFRPWAVLRCCDCRLARSTISVRLGSVISRMSESGRTPDWIQCGPVSRGGADG